MADICNGFVINAGSGWKMYRTEDELRAMLDEVKRVSEETGVDHSTILDLYEHGWKVVKSE